MTEQEELRQLLVKLRNQRKFWGECEIAKGELSMWCWSNGALILTAYLMEPPGSNKVDVIKINDEDRVVGCSPGMISWALERVRKHMILECLSRV